MDTAPDGAARNHEYCPPFNGAMAFQPWILSRLAALDILNCRLQWSHGLSAMDTVLLGQALDLRSLPSMEPWPFSHGYVKPFAGFAEQKPGPSMEPWPFSHGYPPSSGLGRSGSQPFNGAMAFQPWIQGAQGGPGGGPLPLQWSHGLSAMDTGDAKWESFSFSPFNGAMAFQPWIRRACQGEIDEEDLLQWSHGLSAMDTSFQRAPHLRRTSPFNGAMAFQPWIQ